MDHDSEPSVSEERSGTPSDADSDLWRDLGLGVGYSEEEGSEAWEDAASDLASDYEDAARGPEDAGAREQSDSGAEGDVDSPPMAAKRLAARAHDDAGDAAHLCGLLAAAVGEELPRVSDFLQEAAAVAGQEQTATAGAAAGARHSGQAAAAVPQSAYGWRALAASTTMRLLEAGGLLPVLVHDPLALLQSQSPSFAQGKQVINTKLGTRGVALTPLSPGGQHVQVRYDSGRDFRLQSSTLAVRPLLGPLSRTLLSPEHLAQHGAAGPPAVRGQQQQPVVVQEGSRTGGVGVAVDYKGGIKASVALLDPATGSKQKAQLLPVKSLFPLQPRELSLSCISSPQRKVLQAVICSSGPSGTDSSTGRGGYVGGSSTGGGTSSGWVVRWAPSEEVRLLCSPSAIATGSTPPPHACGDAVPSAAAVAAPGMQAASEPSLSCRSWKLPRSQLSALILSLTVHGSVDFEVEKVRDRRAGLEELELVTSGADLAALTGDGGAPLRRRRLASVKLRCRHAAAHGGARNRECSHSRASTRCDCPYALLVYVPASSPDVAVVEEQGRHLGHVPGHTDPRLRPVPEVEEYVHELLNIHGHKPWRAVELLADAAPRLAGPYIRAGVVRAEDLCEHRRFVLTASDMQRYQKRHEQCMNGWKEDAEAADRVLTAACEAGHLCAQVQYQITESDVARAAAAASAVAAAPAVVAAPAAAVSPAAPAGGSGAPAEETVGAGASARRGVGARVGGGGGSSGGGGGSIFAQLLETVALEAQARTEAAAVAAGPVGAAEMAAADAVGNRDMESHSGSQAAQAAKPAIPGMPNGPPLIPRPPPGSTQQQQQQQQQPPDPPPAAKAPSKVLQAYGLTITSPYQLALLSAFGIGNCGFVIADSSYGVTTVNYPLLTLFVRNGSGAAEPVAFGILSSHEGKDAVKLFVEQLEELLELNGYQGARIENWLVDKGTGEVAALEELERDIYLCSFHMKKAIDEKARSLGYGMETRVGIKRDLDCLIFARTEEEFKREQDAFMQRHPPRFVEYYKKQWQSCAERWSMYARPFDVTTTNYAERFFRTLKYTILARRAHLPLATLVRVLVTEVMPAYMRRFTRLHRGYQLSRHGASELSKQRLVQRLVADKRLLVPLGAGSNTVVVQPLRTGARSEVSCLADATCTCSDAARRRVCVHIIAATEVHGGGLTGARQRALEGGMALASSGAGLRAVKGTEWEYSSLLTWPGTLATAAALAVKPPPAASSQTAVVSAAGSALPRCTCSLFACHGLCAHAVAFRLSTNTDSGAGGSTGGQGAVSGAEAVEAEYKTAGGLDWGRRLSSVRAAVEGKQQDAAYGLALAGASALRSLLDISGRHTGNSVLPRSGAALLASAAEQHLRRVAARLTGADLPPAVEQQVCELLAAVNSCLDKAGVAPEPGPAASAMGHGRSGTRARQAEDGALPAHASTKLLATPEAREPREGDRRRRGDKVTKPLYPWRGGAKRKKTEEEEEQAGRVDALRNAQRTHRPRKKGCLPSVGGRKRKGRGRGKAGA